MGCGKTTLAQNLKGYFSKRKIKIQEEAEAYLYFDTDELLQKENHMSIPEMVERYGENYFREKEKNILKKILDEWEEKNPSGAVVSLGGGLLSYPPSRKIFQDFIVTHNRDGQKIKLVWLDTPWDIIVKRLEENSQALQGNNSHHRFLVKGDFAKQKNQLKELYHLRLKDYELAHVRLKDGIFPFPKNESEIENMKDFFDLVSWALTHNNEK